MAIKDIAFDIHLQSTERQFQFKREVAFTNDQNSVRVIFNIKDMTDSELTSATADVLLYMRDGSFYQIASSNVQKSGTQFSYVLQDNKGKHNGIVKVQLVVKFTGDKHLVSRKCEFEIETGLDNVVATEVMIQDWTTLLAQANEYIDEFVENEAIRQQIYEQAEALRQSEFEENEQDRQSEETVRQSNEDTRQSQEATREGNETDRQEAEGIRESQEQDRQEAEDIRSEFYETFDQKLKYNQSVTSRLDQTTRQMSQDINALNRSNPAGNEQATLTTPNKIDYLPKTVANAGMGVSLEGMTVTNLVKNGDFSEGATGVGSWAAGSTRGFTEENTVLIKNTQSNLVSSLHVVYNMIEGHEYYITATMRSVNQIVNRIGVLALHPTATSSIQNPDTNKWYTMSLIRKSEQTRTSQVLLETRSSEETSDYKAEIQSVQVFDLTQTFGAGNEPSKEECDRLFAHYIDGTQSVRPQRVRATGKNLFDKSKVVYGRIISGDSSTGTQLNVASSISGRGYLLIEVKPSTTYTIFADIPYVYRGILDGLKSDGHVVGVNRSNNRTTITTRDTTKLIAINVGSNSDPLTQSDIEFKLQIEEGTTATPYKPYTQTTRYMPSSITLNRLPNGVADTVEDGKFVQQVGATVLKGGNMSALGSPTGWAIDFIRIDGLENQNINNTGSSQLLGKVLIEGGAIQEVPFSSRTHIVLEKISYYISSDGAILIATPRGYFETNTQAREQLAGTRILYQLAQPITHTLPPVGNLLSHPKGSLIKENAVGEVGFYGDGLEVSNPELPIERLDFIRIVDKDSGVETPVDVSKAEVTAGGFIHPDLSDGDLVNWDYYYPEKLTANGNATYRYFDSRYAVVDDVTGKVYRYKPRVSGGELSFDLEEI